MKSRSCLKGETRDTWLKIVKNQLILATDNYVIDNTYGVENFETNRKSLIKSSRDEEAIEDLKTYIQNQKKTRNMRIDSYVRRVKTLNNYTSFMDNGAIKLTEREMIRQVVLKGIPVTWNLNLKRANNHNCATLADLQKVLKSIEEADEVEIKYTDQKKRIDRDNSRKGRGQGSYQRSNEGSSFNRNEGQKAGDKPCRKTGHNHKWKDCTDNRFGINYQDNESNANESRPTGRRNEREVTYEDDNSCNLMIDKMISDEDEDMTNLGKYYESDSEDESDEEDSYLLRNGRPVVTKEKLKTKRTRASVIFSLEDKNGNKMEYIGLLDTGSTGGLISKELVEKYDFQCK